HISGFDVKTEPEKVRKHISLTGQLAAVDGLLTGRENILLSAKLRCEKYPAQTADDLLARFGLVKAADRRADTYSGGMTRRPDIAMSFFSSPDVISLDETTTGLDPEGRIEVWKTIKTLSDGGTTILLTTQYLD
ncbi:ATP-binding cassette domain-containing protein, partial [Listeria monocytogenes]|uniref:ATP-binding cassette domain-containing protein n=1 Tax=Listeria monocytogenes TaxID=1639 RepID=UPI00057EA5E2